MHKKNPKQEYKRESFEMFSLLLDRINHDVVTALSKFEVQAEEDVQQIEARQRRAVNAGSMQYRHAEIDALNEAGEGDTAVQQGQVIELGKQTFTRHAPKVGRNDPCPCGSGKKFKQCHGRIE